MPPFSFSQNVSVLRLKTKQNAILNKKSVKIILFESKTHQFYGICQLKSQLSISKNYVDKFFSTGFCATFVLRLLKKQNTIEK